MRHIHPECITSYSNGRTDRTKTDVGHQAMKQTDRQGQMQSQYSGSDPPGRGWGRISQIEYVGDEKNRDNH